MPIIPIDPAKAVKKVLAFLVIRLLRDKESAVKNDIEGRLPLFFSVFSSPSPEYGIVSSVILPSSSLIIRVEYCFASSGLWVTIITSLALEISFKSSII